jgi:hypothetical protein
MVATVLQPWERQVGIPLAMHYPVKLFFKGDFGFIQGKGFPY